MSDLSLTDSGSLHAFQGSEMERLRRAAAQFEGQFLEIIMRESRGALADDEDGDAIFGGSPALEQFQEMLHGALVERSAGGMGIADLVVQQMLSGQGKSDVRE